MTPFAAVTAPKNRDDNRERDEKKHASNVALREELSAAQRALLDVVQRKHAGPEGLQAMRLHLVNLFDRLERIQGQIDEAFGGQAFLPNARGPTSPAHLRWFNAYFEHHRRASRLLFKAIEVWAFTCSMKLDDDWVPMVIVQMQLEAAVQARAKANRAPKSGEDKSEPDERAPNSKAALRERCSLAQRALLEVIEHQRVGPGGLQATRFLLANLFARIERFQGQIDEAFGAQAFLPTAGPTSPANLRRFNTYFEYHRKVSRLLFKAIEVWAFTCSMKLDDDWVPIVIVHMHQEAAAKARAEANRAPKRDEDNGNEEEERTSNRALRKGLSEAQAYLQKVINKEQVGPEGLQATQLHLVNLFARIERFKGQTDKAFGGQLFLPNAGGPTNPANVRRFKIYFEYYRKVSRLHLKAIEVWALTCSIKLNDDWAPIVALHMHREAAAKARAEAKRAS